MLYLGILRRSSKFNGICAGLTWRIKTSTHTRAHGEHISACAYRRSKLDEVCRAPWRSNSRELYFYRRVCISLAGKRRRREGEGEGVKQTIRQIRRSNKSCDAPWHDKKRKRGNCVIGENEVVPPPDAFADASATSPSPQPSPRNTANLLTLIKYVDSRGPAATLKLSPVMTSRGSRPLCAKLHQLAHYSIMSQTRLLYGAGENCYCSALLTSSGPLWWLRLLFHRVIIASSWPAFDLFTCTSGPFRTADWLMTFDTLF